jgi:diaminohydroxyphosphoribosylaminopyrimidine deaminase/5-amino-6-(5-phosphoribosylamino)uracil reductase
MDEADAMRLAVDLAAKGVSTALPNPVVGCVVLSSGGEVVGTGWHHHAGGPHAEVNALAETGGRARGGTAVVTLEPCNHVGRTGPCAQALIEAGIARVVVAVPDPGEQSGGGAERLRRAGVEVEIGLGADLAERVNEPWLTAVRRSRPFVTWKFAAGLDGRSAAADGTSRWITGPQARRDVHRLRSEVDTMMVGIGTVLADDPALTARDEHDRPLGRQPLRVVIDSRGRTPADARVRDGAAETWIVTADGRDDVDLRATLEELFRRGRRHCLLEGGPRLAGAMLAAGLVDRVVAYLAPVLLGAGPAALGDAGVTTIADALRLEVADVTPIGADLRVTARPVRS